MSELQVSASQTSQFNSRPQHFKHFWKWIAATTGTKSQTTVSGCGLQGEAQTQGDGGDHSSNSQGPGGQRSEILPDAKTNQSDGGSTSEVLVVPCGQPDPIGRKFEPGKVSVNGMRTGLASTVVDGGKLNDGKVIETKIDAEKEVGVDKCSIRFDPSLIHYGEDECSLEENGVNLEEEEELGLDGGWGWAVVIASFTAHAIADGCSYSFGVLFVELLEVFGESRAMTAWIGSLFVAMPSICAPVASLLTSRYGCRVTTIAGALIAATGCVLSSFANSITMLCVTFGFLAGFGLALVFIPAALVVAFYFNRRRATATGMALAGSGIGLFVFAPLTELLIVQYCWRGALLLIGGIMLNIVICGTIFRPLTPTHHSRRKNKSPSSTPVDIKSLLECGKSLEPTAGVAGVDGSTTPSLRWSRYDDTEISHSVVELPTYVDCLPTYLESLSIIHGQDPATTTTTRISTPDLLTEFKMYTHRDKHTIVSGGLHRYVLYRGGLLRARLLITPRSTSCPDVFTLAEQEQQVEESFCVSSCCDVSIFRSAIFLLFCVHCFLLYISYNTPYMYIPDVASRAGINTDTASTLVSIMGLSSTLGQVFMGYVSDRPQVNKLHFYVAMTTVAGAATLAVPLLLTFVPLAVYCSLYGFFISANYALTTVILIDLLGIDRLTNAFGIVSLAGGVAQLIGPPFAGWLADIAMSYDPVFYMSGVVIMLSALMLLCVRCLRSCDSMSSVDHTLMSDDVSTVLSRSRLTSESKYSNTGI